MALNQPSQSEIQDSVEHQEETNALALDVDTSMTNNSSANETTGDNKKAKKGYKSGMTVVEEDDVLYRLDSIASFCSFLNVDTKSFFFSFLFLKSFQVYG